MRYEISLELNGRAIDGAVEPRMTLADFLRRDCGVTDVRLGCEHGVCGSCTVSMDGVTSRSCLTLAISADGAEIETLESLAGPDEYHPLQAAFADHHAVQCGFCTSGMLVTMREFLARNPTPTAVEVRQALSGNICRCTGYQFIVDAVLDASGRLRGEAPSPPAGH
jgi:carbon-monoxide dehydrogenase small subunit